jgi:catechol 2,3-dioxygenase-like lactoylglutathione lyase family enzyme
MVKYLSIYAIAGDPASMPVHDLSASIPFYENTFGFKVDSKTAVSATFVRDDVKWTIVEDTTRSSLDASLHFGVDDAVGAREEIVASGCEKLPRCRVTELKIWEEEDMKMNSFNVIAPDGLCFSVGQNLKGN